MFIHNGFDIIIKCGVSEIKSTHIYYKKKVLYENELINDQNDYNVNKQIFIFVFSTCKMYILVPFLK